MHSDNLKKIVEQKKSGMLNESTQPDYVMFTESPYDVSEPIMLVHPSLTLNGREKITFSESFIKDHDYDVLDESIDKELNYQKELFQCLTKNSLHESTDLNDYANVALYMSCGLPPMGVFKAFKRMVGESEGLSRYLFINENWNDKVVELKRIVLENVKRYNDFIDVDVHNTILDEGMIKVPSKALSIGKLIIDMCIHEAVMNHVYDHSVNELANVFLEKLDITDVVVSSKKKYFGNHLSYDRESGFSGSLDIKLHQEDVPYDIQQKFIPLSIILVDGADYDGMSDEMNGVPFITINVGIINSIFKQYDVLEKPLVFQDKYFVEKVSAIRDELMSTLTHELMHVMQHTVFAQNEYGVPKSTDKEGVGDDPYVTSQVEFDPMIHDAISTFKRNIQSIEGYIGNELSLDDKKELLKKYLGTNYTDGELPESFSNIENVLYNAMEQVFRPTHFIKSIKHDLPEKYPLMVKKIYSELDY